MSAITWLRFDDASTPVELYGATGVLALLPATLGTWHFVPRRDEPAGPKDANVVSEQGERLVIRSRWLDKSELRHDPVKAICALIIEPVWAYLEDHPERLCMHGAKAALAGRLVVFANKYRSAKKLLSGCPAAVRQRLFSSDILPNRVSHRDCAIEEPATGVAPRLRLPLADDLRDGFRQYLDTHAGSKSSLCRYPSLGSDRHAQHCDRLPVYFAAHFRTSRLTRLQMELADWPTNCTLKVFCSILRPTPANAAIENCNQIANWVTTWRKFRLTGKTGSSIR